jgi:cytoskeletal protein RodZ
MSINTKISLSKKLLNVFSMGSRSSKDLTPFQHNNDSQSSLASQTPSLSSVSTASSKKDRSTSFRRRSFASISNLFNKSSPSLPDTAPKQTKSENERRYSSGDLRQLAINKNEKNKPDLQVDTNRKNDQKSKLFFFSFYLTFVLKTIMKNRWKLSLFQRGRCP